MKGLLMVFITEMFTILGGNIGNNKIDENSKSFYDSKHNSEITSKQNGQNLYGVVVKKTCCDENTCNGRFNYKNINPNNHWDINNNDGYTTNKQELKTQRKALRNSTESKDSNVTNSPIAAPHNKNNNNINSNNNNAIKKVNNVNDMNNSM